MTELNENITNISPGKRLNRKIHGLSTAERGNKVLGLDHFERILNISIFLIAGSSKN